MLQVAPTPSRPSSSVATRPEAISIQRAAVVLGVSEKTIRRMIKAQKLEAVRVGVGEKLWRIPIDAIKKLRDRRR